MLSLDDNLKSEGREDKMEAAPAAGTFFFLLSFFWMGGEGFVHVVVFTRRGTSWKTKP